MAKNKGLKQKDIDRLSFLNGKHPADLTQDEHIERQTLLDRLTAEGIYG